MATYFERKQVTTGETIYAGVLAGIIAGIAMSIVAMATAMMMGQEVWAPVKMIAITFLDDAWMERPGFQMTPILAGMMIHFATAIGFGVIFSLLGGRLSYGEAVGWGVLYGLAIWLFMQFFWLPIINPMMAQMPYLPFAIEHAIFGGFLGSYPAFLPSMAKRQAKAERERRAA
jgi:uncharacterized membrane protein YagU involved in acid resistance